MVDLEELYEWIDSEWPAKRHIAVKEKEKEELASIVHTEEDVVKLKNKIEITVFDNRSTPRKLPNLITVISSIGVSTPKPVIVNQVPQEEIEEQEEKVDEAEEAFKEIFYAWPKNEKPQNEKYARIAFLQALKSHPLNDLKKACSRYIQEMNEPAKASLHVLGIKRFVTDDDILDNWLQRASYVSNYDPAYFNAAYAWYPEFNGKEDLTAREDSLSFYKRFIKEVEAVEFLCAVKAYAFECRDKIREEQRKEDYTPGDDNKFTKKFVNFIRTWKKQKCIEEVHNILYAPYLAAMDARKFPYHEVYPEGYFQRALTYVCYERDKGGNESSCVFIVTKMLELMCRYLTEGRFPVRIATKTEPDYSIVSEVINAAKNAAKKLPMEKRND